jgi:hypothetical protein
MQTRSSAFSKFNSLAKRLGRALAKGLAFSWRPVPAWPPVRLAGLVAVDLDQGPQSVLPLDGCRTGEASMEFPHWLMIGGALLVFVGLVGAALQRRPAAADTSEVKVADEQPAVPLPKFLD